MFIGNNQITKKGKIISWDEIIMTSKKIHLLWKTNPAVRKISACIKEYNINIDDNVSFISKILKMKLGMTISRHR